MKLSKSFGDFEKTDKPLEILVADDSQVNLKMCRRILEKMGHNVDCASNGEEVLMSLENKRYHLLLLDCQMPIMDGFEAAKKIYERWQAHERPHIVALTANSYTEIQENPHAQYFDGYLSKSFQLDELQETIAQIHKEVKMKKKPSKTHPTKAQEHAVMNQSEFLQNFSGIEELISPTIEQFLLQYPILMEKIKFNIVEKNHKELEINAHTLKGSLAIFRAQHCVSVAKELEYMGKNNTFEDAMTCYGNLVKEGERLVNLLKTLKEQVAA